MLRFLRWQAAGADEAAVTALAKAEGVSVATFKASVRLVEGYRAQNTGSEMDLAVRDLVISTAPHAKNTLAGLLAATELVEQKDSRTGKVKVVRVEDKTTRLEAFRAYTNLVSNLQPKQAPVEVNVNQTNQQANVVSKSETFEERMRRLRQKAQEHNLLPPAVAGVPDYIDAGEDNDDGDDEDDEDESDDDE